LHSFLRRVTELTVKTKPIMDLGSWQKKSTDVVRLRRLAAGWVTGTAVMGGTLGLVALTAAKAYGFKEDQVIEAAIVDRPEEEQHVEAEPEPEKKEAPKPKPAVAPLVEPVKLDDKLVEKQPVNSDNPYGGDDPYALLENAASAPEAEKPKVAEAPKIIEKVKAVVPQKAAEPVRLTEEDTPPRAIVQTSPQYPAEAKAAGIEGTVVVDYVVTEKGEVTEVKAVKGPPELYEVCVAAVKSWRFMAAMNKDGKPISAHRRARFPFRIKT
jgi:protein TonB